MDLTPIKIRGKKKTAQTVHSRRLLGPLLNPGLKGKRHDRPAESTSDLLATPPAKTARLATSRAKLNPVSKPASALERLPTELLESIFFLCLNISLPQASPVIGQALASKHVKSQLVLRVLSSGHTDEPPNTPGKLVQEQAELQSAILRTKWMTLPFLQDMIPDYIVSTIIREFTHRSILWLGKEPVTGKSGPMIREHLKDPQFDHNGNPGLPGCWEASWPATNRLERIYLRIGLRDGLVTLRTCQKGSRRGWVLGLDMGLSYFRWRILCGVEGCQIPEKLLHCPWTDEKCEFLEVAIRGNATVDWVGSTSGEVAERGLLEAIREHSPGAIRALLAGEASPPDTRESFYKSLSLTCHTNHQIPELSTYCDLPARRGVGIVPNQVHLRMAVVEEDCPQNVVEALLSAAKTDFDVDDGAVSHWIVRMDGKGDPRADWLHTRLKGW